MPSFVDLIVADGKATPVNHTFKVKSCNDQIAIWEDRVNGIALGYWTAKVKTEDGPNVRKVMVWLNQPILEAVAGANQSGYTPAAKIAYLPRSYTEFYLPLRSTKAERTDLVKMHLNLLGLSSIQALAIDGEEFVG